MSEKSDLITSFNSLNEVDLAIFHGWFPVANALFIDTKLGSVLIMIIDFKYTKTAEKMYLVFRKYEIPIPGTWILT